MLMYLGRTAFFFGKVRGELLMNSVNPEFGTTVARRLNHGRAYIVLQSDLIAIKFGTAEARPLNCSLRHCGKLRKCGMSPFFRTLSWNSRNSSSQ